MKKIYYTEPRMKIYFTNIATSILTGSNQNFAVDASGFEQDTQDISDNWTY